MVVGFFPGYLYVSLLKRTSCLTALFCFMKSSGNEKYLRLFNEKGIQL